MEMEPVHTRQEHRGLDSEGFAWAFAGFALSLVVSVGAVVILGGL